MNNFQLQKGQKVGCILYDGNSLIEATATYNYLETTRKSGKPMPLGTTNLFVTITEVEMVKGENDITQEITYQVRFEGVL